MEHQTSIFYKPVNALLGAMGIHVADHVIMALFVLLVCSTVFPLATRNLSKDNPGRFQHLLELFIGGIKSMLDDVVGHGSAKFLNVICGFAVFIFFSNMAGQFFFLQPPTANTNTTFALSISAFLYYNYQGIRTQGVKHYILHFMGPIAWLAPLMFPIEVIGHLARILSLGMRLFGNIFGEHTATGIFVGMFPLLLPWPMMGLGLFGSFLQTFVFIMLTMVYIGGAVTAEEH